MSYAKATYTGDGVTLTFSVPFPYLSSSHVKVYVNDVLSTGLTFPSAGQVTLTYAPANGAVVVVLRATPITTREVDWASGSLFGEDNLDLADLQIFYVTQEAYDAIAGIMSLTTDESAWDALAVPISNLSDGVVGSDAATVGQLQTIGTDNGFPSGTGHASQIIHQKADETGVEYLTPANSRTALGLGALALKATVGTADIDATSITQAKMANDSVGAAQIIADSVGWSELSAAYFASFPRQMSGLEVSYTAAGQVTVGAGVCVDSGSDTFMTSTANIVMDITTSGANGLDTGAEANSTWYFIWLIKNPTTGTVAGLLSTSNSAPTMPSGYTKKRLLMAVYNDSAGAFVPFISTHLGNNVRDVHYRDSDASATYGALVGGNATAAFTNPGGGTNVSFAQWVPGGQTQVFVDFWTTESAGTVTSFVKNPDSISTVGRRVSNTTAATTEDYTLNDLCVLDTSRNLSYRLAVSTGTFSIYVRGFRFIGN